MARTLSIGKDAKQLFELLRKAAGLEEKKFIRTIECRVSYDECVSFKVEFLADDEDVSMALGGKDA